MHYITDLHLHSRFSRACSKSLTLPNLEKWCEYKGVDIVGTADFTHPVWNKELHENLEYDGGLYRLKNSKSKVRFLPTTEISLIYKQGDKTRKNHILVFAPTLEAVDKITAELGRRGNIKSDGRPILGIKAPELAEIALSADPKCLIVPAHIWTPWFSMFGSKSGCDSIEECFGPMAQYIYAIEKGLSASMEMNWMVSELDNRVILADSDAHSLEKLGREANVFDLNTPSYDAIYDLIRNHRIEKMPYSINFFPEEGKYHLDGHVACGVRLFPKETFKYKGLCPKCQKPVTKGVLSRVYELADREEGQKPAAWTQPKSIVPLMEIISQALGKGISSKAVVNEYFSIIKHAGEFKLLLDWTAQDLLRITSPKIAEGIIRVREGKIQVVGGYDGVFGTVKIWGESDKIGQSRLI
ncbi:MAG: hypothetical protein G01um101418_972 [Parcubacteria group bacterium Gr01-1014_18]|nr:MAG: hypothetical protein Greene041636_975 [Parcubacteria group bacterium Greene0416_36]TSC79512.1 MAG: hypothetical protein G01um101418_972 [Parcubacteria group bacterium Gr01-1014_18]TSC97818.1 MAG: hypothetical protein Greene101420_982 [Parcubacteria group bacterium Greene1014_20]TSD05955.1 MAG: hypothetical protein Greene07142_978 [Parcubacteria group bacterium Greene0714_2]